MSTPTPVPPVTPELTPEVVQTASKLVRAKTLVKTAFIKVGVPVLIGVAAASVVSRRNDSQDDIVEESILTDW